MSRTRPKTIFEATTLEAQCAWRRDHLDGSDLPMLPHWLDGIHPDLRGDAQQVVNAPGFRPHTHLAAVNSSQAFGLNLWLPFLTGSRGPLESTLRERLGSSFTIENISFEWIPPGAWLGEIAGDLPLSDENATAVDVVLWGRDAEGATVAVLVEVKFSEAGFTCCSGADSPHNGNRAPCDSARVFLDDPSACYLQRPVGKLRDRRYWEILARSHGSVAQAVPGADPNGPCPFRGHAYQPMRNQVVAEAMVQEGRVDRSWFLLCAHDQNPDVAAHWADWTRLLAPQIPAPRLAASRVVEAGRQAGWTGWAEWMIQRYQL